MIYNFVRGGAVALFAFVAPISAEDAKGPDAGSLDGAWTVVCSEKGGEVQVEATGMAVKAESGTITCSGKDGKPAMTLKVVLGQHGTVQVTEVSVDTSAPVSALVSGCSS